MRSPFPLQWPDDTPRTKPGFRRASIFQSSFATARENVRNECTRLDAANVVITSMLPVNRFGEPIAAGVSDPAIALWFVLDGRERVFACDKWLTPAANLQAIAKTLEAMRGVDRWGVAGAQKRLFAGFAALPPGSADAPEQPVSVARPWRDVIGGVWPGGLEPAELLAIAKARHRAAIAKAHPDVGGDPARAAELNAALDRAEQEVARG